MDENSKIFESSKSIKINFNLWSKRFEASYDLFLAELEARIVDMQFQGMNDFNILRVLNGEILNENDIFAGLMGKAEKYTDDLLSTIAQYESNSFDLNEMVVWVLDPNAQHCEEGGVKGNGCPGNSELPAKTFAEWQRLGMPGSGTTECRKYCRCSLEIFA